MELFFGNCSNSGKIFTLQKKIFRIMTCAQPSTSYRCLFKQLEGGFVTFYARNAFENLVRPTVPL